MTRQADLRLIPPSPERVAARLSRMANGDTVFGGFAAVCALRRLATSPHLDLYDEAVTRTYARSNGRAWEETDFRECPECGTAVFGESAALTHCEEVR